MEKIGDILILWVLLFFVVDLLVVLFSGLSKIIFIQISNNIITKKLKENVIPKIFDFFSLVFDKIGIIFFDIVFGINDKIDEWKWNRSKEKYWCDKKIEALGEESKKK